MCHFNWVYVSFNLFLVFLVTVMTVIKETVESLKLACIKKKKIGMARLKVQDKDIKCPRVSPFQWKRTKESHRNEIVPGVAARYRLLNNKIKAKNLRTNCIVILHWCLRKK